MRIGANWTIEKDKLVRQKVAKYLATHPDKLAEFQESYGRLTVESYFEEYADQNDIGVSLVNDLNLPPQLVSQARKPDRPKKAKPFDPFEL